MPKQAKFRPVKSDEGWRLNIPAKVSLSGRRERYFFQTREEALAEASKLRNRRDVFGAQASAIAPGLAEQATAAAALLAPYGLSLLEAAERAVRIEKAKDESVPVRKALAEFEKAKEGKSAKQVQAIRHMTKHLLEDFADRKLSSITGQEVAVHIGGRTNGPAAFNGRLRLLITFWRWSAKPPRGWCKTDVLEHVERKDSISSEITILNAEEAANLMKAAEEFYPDTVPAFAIALFTGMQQQEIDRLEPADITADGITVPATSAKTKRRRFIQMPAPLAEWLKIYPIGDFVTPPNWQRKEKAVRRMAGWKVWSDLVPALKVDPPLSAEPPDDAPEWPQNALRHTAASVALALGKALESLIFEHGHAGGVEMLRRHYIGRMPKRDALAIWSIGPHGSNIPNLNVA